MTSRGKPLKPALDHAGSHRYLDDMHPVSCTECECTHYQVAGFGRSCACGHQVAFHRFDFVRKCVTENQISRAEANAARLNKAYGLVGPS